MADFASDAWITAFDESVRASDALRAATADFKLVIRQCVTDGSGGDRSWHITADHGSVRVDPGPGEHADVIFTQDDATARAVGSGQMSAQAAFMLGKLRIGGDVAKLMEHAGAFDELDDLFDELRASTTF